jgi:hypothetical protein
VWPPTLYIPRCAALLRAIKNQVISYLSLSSLRLGGIILPEKTAEGYELRSRGPASQGFDVLDSLVSQGRRSSPLSDLPTNPLTTPPSPTTSTNDSSPSIHMAEPTLADVVEMMKAMQADITRLKEKSDSSSSSGAQHERPRDIDHPPKFQKWDFPRFDGKTDPLLFINKCESYFRQQRTLAEQQVWMALYNLEGIAQHWYIQLQEDEGTPSWSRFRELLNLRFEPALCSAPFFELIECRRTSTVKEYSNRFQELLPHVDRMAEEQHVQLYTGGLLPPLSHAVRILNPDNLNTAMSLAQQVEQMELAKIQAPAKPGARGLLPLPPPRPAPQALPMPQAPLALPAPPMGAAPGRGDGSRRLSPEEMADQRCQGLCFNCNEKYSRGHNRFCKRIFSWMASKLRRPRRKQEDLRPTLPVSPPRSWPGSRQGTPCRSPSPSSQSP